MIEITDNDLKSILALQRSNPPAWTRFMDWISKLLLDKSSESINIKDEVELRWAQGRQQIMSELIDIFNNTEEIIVYKSKITDDIQPSLVFD